MNRVQILDCTLRDGGYINQFQFGFHPIRTIIRQLSLASIDIIECGFLKSGANDKDTSLFDSVEALREVICQKNPSSMYVAMIQYGAITADEISPFDDTSIDGIRLTFHEHEIDEAFLLGASLKEKGYAVFMQPVGTSTYEDSNLLSLIKQVNKLDPYAFYLVDTLGTMYQKDLHRMFHLIDHNLNPEIILGFHSHNNLQLSFANAMDLISIQTSRRLIIDSSVFGLGRGAGNLCTELITRYINETFGFCYDMLPILEILDEQIRPLKIKYEWGYDAAYYLASAAGCHPNYASFLLNKQTLRVPDINAILQSLPESQKCLYHKSLIEKAYLHYMAHQIQDDYVISQLRSAIKGRNVLLAAPGKSIKRHQDSLLQFIKEQNPFVISIQFYPMDFDADMIFCANLKRYHFIREYMETAEKKIPLLITSNIAEKNDDIQSVINYGSYLNDDHLIVDNAGLMCLNLLKKAGADKVFLAGYDGFRINQQKNYYHRSLYLDMGSEKLYKVNSAISTRLDQLKKQMELQFLTPSAYVS
ncbi:MAG: aldolase catalytic domain-containing protein [Lachnospiraceae bacterium]|nr:aldolase catalytic domain-containing protein [Lachnospiraceae bacterium]